MIQKILLLWAVTVLTICIPLKSQDLRINEVMASNTVTILDEDGDASDWLELYNYGSETIDLAGFGLSDSSDPDSFWDFPTHLLAPGEYLLVFASDKDRKTPPVYWETVIDQGDDWKYLVPTAEPSLDWRTLGFDDSGWEDGQTSIGCGDGDDLTVVENVNAIYLRKAFTVDQADLISEVLLHIDYDDGFVAYLNGTEIARSGLTDPIPVFDASSALHEAVMYSGGTPESFPIPNGSNLLVDGENVLAVQVHNTSSTSSDLTTIPFLTLGSTSNMGGGTSDFFELYQNSFHTDFKISASGDSLFIRNSSLEIIDTLVTGLLRADLSIGRMAGDDLFYFSTANPGSANPEMGFESISSEVVFSQPGGLYSGTIQVEISSDQTDAQIYYTLDGSVPTAADLLYSTAISISEHSVLRARILDDTSIPGPVLSASYLIKFESKGRIQSERVIYSE